MLVEVRGRRTTSNDSKFRAASTWILLYFFDGGLDRGTCNPCTAMFTLQIDETFFDHSVFDRVEANNGDPAARREHFPRAPQPFLERAELVVDCDAQRLKGFRRRVQTAIA